MVIYPKEQIVEIKTQQDLNRLKLCIDKDDLTSYDTETTGLAYTDRPFMQTVYAGGVGFVIDKRRSHDRLWRDVAEVCLASPVLLGQNLPYDLTMARNEWGLRFKGRVHDTLIQTFLINENESHKLKVQTERLWAGSNELETKVLEWLDANNGGKKNYDLVPFELMSHYAVQDTYLTRKLHDVKYPIVRTAPFNGVYDTECELVKCLVDMRRTGVRLDISYLKGLIPVFEQEMAILTPQIHALAGMEFNIGSDVQLADVIYRKLGCRPKVYTEKGEPSTNREALVSLEHPIGKQVLQWRSAETSLATFVKPWLEFADADGYLHPNLNQVGTRSGRFSSQDPNCQQIPKRSPSAKILRKAFIYPDGKVGGSTDQSQMEMVGFAHYSGDPVMKQALIDKKDLHRMTAVEAEIAPSEAECTSDHRRLGKGANFSVVFGCGGAKLGSFLSQDMYAGRYVSPEEAAQIIGKYKMRFTQVVTFQRAVINKVRTRPGHYVQNMFGRQCRLSPQKAYVGVNRLVQSWAADMAKWGMVQAWKYAQQPGNDIRLYLNVHDDLKWFSSPETFMEHARAVDRFLSECPFPLSVPIRTETTRSETNWADEEVVHLD